MKTKAHGTDRKFVPVDYADLFRVYYPYVIHLVKATGIPISSVEDVACDIMVKLYEKDYLHMFDPTKVFVYDGVEYPARFQYFLTKIVTLYLRGFYEREMRRNWREPIWCDMPVDTRHNCVRNPLIRFTWGEINGASVASHEDEILEMVYENNLIADIRAYIETIPSGSSDRCDLDLLRLFDELIAQIRQKGKWSLTELCTKFSISGTAMNRWVWRLRQIIADYLGGTLPARRVRVVQ